MLCILIIFINWNLPIDARKSIALTTQNMIINYKGLFSSYFFKDKILSIEGCENRYWILFKGSFDKYLLFTFKEHLIQLNFWAVNNNCIQKKISKISELKPITVLKFWIIKNTIMPNLNWFWLGQNYLYGKWRFWTVNNKLWKEQYLSNLRGQLCNY